jgi:diguanylate cyclase (GGDEF)-like protein
VTGAIGVGRTNPVWVSLAVITVIGTAAGAVAILICPWPSFRTFALIAVTADFALAVASFYPTNAVYALFTCVALTLPGALICAELDRTAMRVHLVWVGLVLSAHTGWALAATSGVQERLLVASFALSTGAVLFGTLAMELSLRNVLIESAREHAHAAVHDQLTTMLNRRGLWEQIPLLVMDAAPADRITVALLDLDDFKQVNDAYGHEAGDAVLAEVARSVIEHAPRDALVARIGGEEFAIFTIIADDAPVAEMASSLLESVRIREAPWTVTGSVGIASEAAAVLRTGPTLNDLLRRADDAMYQAKRAGGDRYVVAPHSGHRRSVFDAGAAIG